MYDLVKTFHFSKSNATKIYNALRSSTSSLSSASSLAGTIVVQLSRQKSKLFIMN